MRPAIAALSFFCLCAASAAAQGLPPEQQAKLEELAARFRPVQQFSYVLETEVSFSFRGQRVTSLKAELCDVVEDRGSLTRSAYGIISVPSGGDNHHAVLDDGSALVIYQLNPCVWTEAPPSVGSTYHIGPDTTLGLAKAPMAPPAMVAWLDHASHPQLLRLQNLEKFIESEEVTNFQVLASITSSIPPSTIASDIPVLAEVADLAQFMNEGTLPREDIGAERAVFFQARQLDAKAGATHPGTQEHADGQRWVLLSGSRSGPGSERVQTSISKSAPERIEIDLDVPMPGHRIGLALSFIASRLKPAPYEPNPTKLQAWPFQVCIEGDCMDLQVPIHERNWGGYESYYSAYHPPTGRVVELVILESDLTLLLR
ncbi:MAG TPA: hypothetical protein VGN80_12155 [Devosiaceae bacterium]|jgi:hypothetical protein|nr:hypothetical protein [Devosiaceae bacterium]